MKNKVKREGSYIYIPKRLAIEYDTGKHDTVESIKNYNKDHLFYLLDLITRLKYLVEKNQVKPYVEISREALKSRVSSYKSYLHYAIQAGILKRSYYKKGKPFGYCFTKYYTSAFNSERPVVEKLVRRRLHQLRPRENKLPAIHQHLVKWLRADYLQVNYKACSQWLEKETQRRISEVERTLHTRGKRKRALSEIEGFHKGQHMLLDSIRCKSFNLSVDTSGYRFHSPLTQLKKELRHFISFKDEKGYLHPLVNIDIKNSQPYFSSFLFSEKFLQFIAGGKCTDIFIADPIFDQKIQALKRTIPVEDWLYYLKNIKEEDIIKYKQFTAMGVLYEKMVTAFSLQYDRSFSREEVKDLMMTTFFSRNGNKVARKKIFLTQFPNVYKLFYLLKEQDHAFLAVLLQHIESYLVLNIICKRISQEQPSLPLYTIHDSIVTIPEGVSYVQQAMKEELQDHIGYVPTLKSEEWRSR